MSHHAKKFDSIIYLNGEPVTVKATIIPADPTVGEPQYCEDFRAYSEDGTELQLSEEEEAILTEEMWKEIEEADAIKKCILRHGYDKCWDAGLL